MRIEDYPNLLIKDRLGQPLDLAIAKVRETEQHLTEAIPEVLLHGAFVMVVASMDVALSEVLRYLLRSFPQKIDKKELHYTKEEFFGNYFRLVEASVDRYVTELSYKGFQEYFRYIIKALSVDWDAGTDQGLAEKIQEIRASRNLLLHNSLIVNDIYIDQSGSKGRAKDKGGKLKVDLPYVRSSFNDIIQFEDKLRELIVEKYKDYTRVAANKRLWDFLFSSPVMPFDDFWEYDGVKDHIWACKKGIYEDKLSNSERLLLGLWRAHFNSNTEYLRNFHMRSFDRRHQEKVFLFLSIAPDFIFE